LRERAADACMAQAKVLSGGDPAMRPNPRVSLSDVERPPSARALKEKPIMANTVVAIEHCRGQKFLSG